MALPAPRHCLRLVTAITEGGSHLAALPIALELLDVRGNDAGLEVPAAWRRAADKAGATLRLLCDASGEGEGLHTAAEARAAEVMVFRPAISSHLLLSPRHYHLISSCGRVPGVTHSTLVLYHTISAVTI